MSLSVVLYGPRHEFWRTRWSRWCYGPDEYSTGGIGFKVPFVHVCFMWGRR